MIIGLNLPRPMLSVASNTASGGAEPHLTPNSMPHLHVLFFVSNQLLCIEFQLQCCGFRTTGFSLVDSADTSQGISQYTRKMLWSVTR